MKIFKYIKSKLFKKCEEENSNTSNKDLGINLSNILIKENIKKKFYNAIEKNLSSINIINEIQLSKLKKIILSDLDKGYFNSNKIYKLLTEEFRIEKKRCEFNCNTSITKI